MTRNRPSVLLNDPGAREYFALLRIAHSQIADDPEVTDKERCARAMVEAYYRGQLDRERLAASA